MNNNPELPYFFVLGAPDHEMMEIRRICREEGLMHAHATFCGTIARSEEAYQATGIKGLLPKEPVRIVFVECNVASLRYDDLIDHHQPGDFGYGRPPQEYLEGSSLGQFLAMIGKEPTTTQRVIAAADHCLMAAYRGDCPGVSPEAVKEFRETSRCMAQRIDLPELRRKFEAAHEALRVAPRITIEDVPVAWFESSPPSEMSEVSARLGIPYAYVRKQGDGRVKSAIRSAPARVVSAWIERCGLKNIYGDPQRGFAGGYF